MLMFYGLSSTEFGVPELSLLVVEFTIQNSLWCPLLDGGSKSDGCNLSLACRERDWVWPCGLCV